MDLEKIKAFIELAKKEGVSELSYEKAGEKLKVSLPVAGALPVSLPREFAAVETTHVQAREVKASPSPAADSQVHEVRSPFVGTFYTSPSPSDPVFVKVGDRVSKGQVLCILEAMKIMNEIESDVSGTVVKICVDNESLVEYGQALFHIKV